MYTSKYQIIPMSRLPYSSAAIIQKWCALGKGQWSYADMKIVFSFCQYTYGVPCQLSRPHDTLHVPCPCESAATI